jgi:hypothetical protein
LFGKDLFKKNQWIKKIYFMMMSFHGKLKKNHVTKVKPANCKKFFLPHIHILDGRLQNFKLGKPLDTRARQNAYISLLRNV